MHAPATLNLTSSKDAACPDMGITYTCTVTDAGTITWTAAPVLVDPALVQFAATSLPNERMRRCSDPSTTVQCTELDYLANLTSVGTVDINGLADLTSTFSFTATANLSGTVVQCSALTAAGMQTANRNLIFAGKYVSV